MQLTLPRTMLFALALILGQWLALAHASEHPALQPDKAGCELCLHVHQLGTAAPAGSAAPVAITAHEAPSLAVAPRATRGAPPRLHPIRGPPRLPA